MTDKQIKDSLNEGQTFLSYVHLKLQKLSAAIYMTTEFLSDREPLRWRLRQKSLDLLDQVGVLLKDSGINLGALSNLRLEVDVFCADLQVALMGGAVSKMNFEILKQEYENLCQEIGQFSHAQSLPNYLFVPKISPQVSSGFAPLSQQIKNPALSSGNNLASVNVKQKAYNGQKDNSINDLYGLNNVNDKRSIRKEQISSWLKDKTWTSITDIAKALPDCGLKTIQRELLEMVSLGLLKKQGERRWSRYMLA